MLIKKNNMTTKIKFTSLLVTLLFFSLSGCVKDGATGPAGQDATVYYSEWFYPSEWSGVSGDWYFAASAPDLTESIVENGVILAYVWLAGDLYDASTIRPLRAFAVGANWSFLVHEYGSIEFTCDMVDMPATKGINFRFVAIPGTVTALKSTSAAGFSEQELRDMSYLEVCKLFNIPYKMNN